MSKKKRGVKSLDRMDREGISRKASLKEERELAMRISGGDIPGGRNS